jgi:hypothetical protein
VRPHAEINGNWYEFEMVVLNRDAVDHTHKGKINATLVLPGDLMRRNSKTHVELGVVVSLKTNDYRHRDAIVLWTETT